jgi:hypothetical protein
MRLPPVFRRALVAAGLVVGVAATWLCAGFGAWCVRIAFGGVCHRSPAYITSVRVTEVEQDVDDFVLSEGRCPASIDELVEKRYLKGRLDAWQTPLFIGCWGQNRPGPLIVVRSAGADRVFSTSDDIESGSL